MEKSKPIDVSAYIKDSDIEAQPILNELRNLIKATVPKAEEGINNGVPFYRYCGELVGFAAFSEHVSFGFGAAVLKNEMRAMLEEKGYLVGKGSVQIQFNQKVPVTEITELLKAKANMNETHRMKK